MHEPVANHTNTFFVAAEVDLKLPATPQEKMYENEDKLPVIPTKKTSVTADDDKKPAATLLEEMLRTMQEPPVIHPPLPPFGSSVVA